MNVDRLAARSRLVVWLALAAAAAPVVAVAQPAGDAAAVREAVKVELTKPGSAVRATDVTVTGVQFEGVFATAVVTVRRGDPPTVFLKKAGARWKVIFVGTVTEPGLCGDLGFPANSKMCPD